MTIITTDWKCDPESSPFEVVERKGVGHPDTLADGIAELGSVLFSQYCLSEFGAVLHHNLDKVAVIGGWARFSWTDGHYERPLRVVFGGRASSALGSRQIPVREILEEAASQYLSYALPGYRNMPVEFVHLTRDSSKRPYWFRPRDLDDLPELRRPRANDTAFLIGNSPRTRAETIALLFEAELRKNEWAGSDIKVLVVRREDSYKITACVPILVGHAKGPADYMAALAAAHAQLLSRARTLLPSSEIDLVLNSSQAHLLAHDEANAGYVNMSGSATDYGEDGMVGRGNGRGGLIVPQRMHGNEVLFGKNPTYHVGKVVGYFVDEIATRLSSLGVAVECAMTTRNGCALSTPATCAIRVSGDVDRDMAEGIVADVMGADDRIDAIVKGRRYVPSIAHAGYG